MRKLVFSLFFIFCLFSFVKIVNAPLDWIKIGNEWLSFNVVLIKNESDYELLGYENVDSKYVYTPYPFTDAHLPLAFYYSGLFAPNEVTLDLSKLKNFVNYSIRKYAGNLDRFKGVEVRVLINKTYEKNVSIPIYKNVIRYYAINSTNTTNTTFLLPENCEIYNKTHYYCNETEVVYKYKTVEHWKWTWVNLKSLSNLVIKKDKIYAVDVNGKFKAGIKPLSIDVVPSFSILKTKINIEELAWWNSSWQYRRPITITEQSGSTLTDYQVKLTIDTANLISEGKMNSDCSDIRFTDENDNEIPYWIENGCNSANTIIWVKVPNIPANGQTTIYMYYGNPDATSESNGDEVFIFWDDFSSDTGKWSIECGTVSWSNGQVILITDAVKDACASIKTSSTFTTDKPIIVYTKALSTNDTNSVSTQPLIIGNTSVSYLVWIHSDTRYSGEKNYSLSVRDITGTFNNYYTDFPVDTKWHEFEFRLKDNHQEEWIDGNKEKEVNKIISLIFSGGKFLLP